MFGALQTNWLCNLVYRPGNAYYDKLTQFTGPVIGVRSDVHSMIDLALSNQVRIVLMPITSAEPDLFALRTEWDRATAGGILVVVPHNRSSSTSRQPAARRLSPPRLYSAITVGAGTTSNLLSFGPGLEFFDAPRPDDSPILRPAQQDAAAVIAAKLSRILDLNPSYNIWDARQHLRQSASAYSSGWTEDGGYGRPPGNPSPLQELDLAPPLDLQAMRSPDGSSVTFSWLNFRQSRFDETVITCGAEVIYHGTNTTFTWRCDRKGDADFHFYSVDHRGQRSREESYTKLHVTGLTAS